MKLIDLIYPPRCPLCGNVTTEKDKTFPLCERCFDLQKKEKFDKITDATDYLPQNKAFYCAYKYNGLLRDAVIKYKFNGEIWMAKPFSIFIINAVEKCGGFESVDYLTYVPVSQIRLAERGYDQTFEIVKEISKSKGIPILKCLLKDNNNGDNASEKKNRHNRVSEKGYFFIGKKNEIKNKNILLVDDILTTGATIMECTELLLENGAKTVSSAVLASGRKDF